jgi:hypothetical protein
MSYDTAKMRMNVFADDLTLLLAYIEGLEAENQELRDYRDKYNTLLDESLKHGQAMMGHLLTATIEGHLK